jgi:hypothetical protein
VRALGGMQQRGNNRAKSFISFYLPSLDYDPESFNYSDQRRDDCSELLSYTLGISNYAFRNHDDGVAFSDGG